MAQTISSAILLLFGTLILIAAQDVPEPTYESLGGGFFPTILALLLMGLSTAVMIRGAKTWRAQRAARGKQAGTERLGLWSPANQRVVVSALLTLAYVLALRELGFVISTIAFLFVIMTYLSRRTKKDLAYIGVITLVYTVTVHYIFQSLLKIFLP